MQIRLKETILVSMVAVSAPILVAYQVSHQITVGDGYQEYVDHTKVHASISDPLISTGHVDNFKAVNEPLVLDDDLALPMDIVIDESTEAERREYVVTQGDTLIGILSSLGVNSSDITTLLYASSLSQKDFQIVQSNEIVAYLSEGDLVELELHKGGSSYDVYARADNDFEKSVEAYPSSIVEVKIDLEIKNSFSADANEAGLTTLEANELARNLRHVIDFRRLKPGHKFRVVADREIRNGKVVKSSIKGVSYISQENSDVYYKFAGSYFDGDGLSLTPVFLKHPIQSEGPPLITSRFNLKRLHPILKIRRPHYGTDYGYLTGTPVVSISDSQVIYAGKKGSFGNIVKLKHPNGIITLSAHLSKIKNGVARGQKIKKGEVIGYVGSTGISTGPHLHFEMFVNGRRVDSTKVDLPTDGKVKDFDEFRKFVSSVDFT